MRFEEVVIHKEHLSPFEFDLFRMVKGAFLYNHKYSDLIVQNPRFDLMVDNFFNGLKHLVEKGIDFQRGSLNPYYNEVFEVRWVQCIESGMVGIERSKVFSCPPLALQEKGVLYEVSKFVSQRKA